MDQINPAISVDQKKYQLTLADMLRRALPGADLESYEQAALHRARDLPINAETIYDSANPQKKPIEIPKGLKGDIERQQYEAQ